MRAKTLTAWLVVGCGLWHASGVWGQVVTTPDEFLDLVPLRATTEIAAEIAVAERDLAAAQNDEREAASLKQRMKDAIDAKDEAIKRSKQQRSEARRGGTEADVKSHEAERKALEREKDLLERRESLRDAEIDVARQRAALAALVRQALELEQQLALRKSERRDADSPRGPSASSEERVMLDLERQTLQAQIRVAEKRADVVSREKRVAERLVKILDARRAVQVY